MSGMGEIPAPLFLWSSRHTRAEASLPDPKDTTLSLLASGPAVGVPGNVLSRQGKEASFMWQEDVPCASPQSKGKPDPESQKQLVCRGAWALGRFWKPWESQHWAAPA